MKASLRFIRLKVFGGAPIGIMRGVPGVQTGAARVMDGTGRKSVMVCESQPVTSEGLRSVVDGCADLKFAGAADSPAATLQLLAVHSPDVLILDKSFGAQALLETLSVLRTSRPDTAAVVWGIRSEEHTSELQSR